MPNDDSPDAPLRKARHDLRGRLNALKLCASALPIITDKQELLDFLQLVEQSADQTIEAMSHLESLMPADDAAQNGSNSA